MKKKFGYKNDLAAPKILKVVINVGTGRIRDDKQAIEDIIKIASEKGLGESEVDEVMQKLKKAGDIFEPRQGFISRI